MAKLLNIFVLILIIKFSESRGGQRMVNGVESEHQPFVVSVRHRMDSPFGVGHFCGGSILSSNAILTAASCIRTVIADEEYLVPANDLVVVSNTNMRYQMINAIQSEVLDIHIHPNYDPADRSENIAILIIDPLPLNTRNVESRNITWDHPIPGSRCEIYGFGQARSLVGPPQKLVGIVQIFERFSCKEPRLNMICAGEDTYPCNGDDGGPLVCDNRIAGIIDYFGVGHCLGPVELRHISYVDVSSYRRWIQGILNQTAVPFDPQSDSTPSSSYSTSIIFFSFLLNFFVAFVLI